MKNKFTSKKHLHKTMKQRKNVEKKRKEKKEANPSSNTD
jgi:hypothetical protein